ncbi:MAG TPA: glycosyltransferase family 4 protein [Chthoniobacterales bacterium]
MKIALFHNLHPGGAKRALYEHARALRERGHSLDGYTLSTAAEGYLPMSALCQHVHTYELVSPPARRFRLLQPLLPGKRFARLLRRKTRDQLAIYLDAHRLHREQDRLEELYARMAADIDSRGYDLVYVHQCHLSLSPALLRFLKTPTLYYAQDTLRYVYEWSLAERPDYNSTRESFYTRKMLGQLYPLPFVHLLRRKEQQYVASTRAAGLVLANSCYSREAIVRTTGTNPRVCYLGVDAEFFRPEPRIAREAEVLSVGALAPNKRHDFIIHALATIPAERRPALRIIGYELEFGRKALGPVANGLVALAERSGVSLQIDKEVSDDELRLAYQRAGVVAFAPVLEPFGFIPLEAMASAAPVVGVREGGLRETIEDGVTGLLTDRVAADFGAAIARILADKPLAEELGANGRARVLGRWTWQRSADELERWMCELAGARASCHE